MNKQLFFGCLGAFLIGLVITAFYRQVLIIRLPGRVTTFMQEYAPINKRKINLFFWRRGAWGHEAIELVVSENVGEMMTRMANAWLTVLEQEGILKKRVMVQTVILSGKNHYAYLSFDRNPFDKNISTNEKLMFVQGLLKTFKDNGIVLQGIYFQAHHQPLQDYHLDFNGPWPLEGFIEKASS